MAIPGKPCTFLAVAAWMTLLTPEVSASDSELTNCFSTKATQCFQACRGDCTPCASQSSPPPISGNSSGRPAIDSQDCAAHCPGCNASCASHARACGWEGNVDCASESFQQCRQRCGTCLICLEGDLGEDCLTGCFEQHCSSCSAFAPCVAWEGSGSGEGSGEDDEGVAMAQTTSKTRKTTTSRETPKSQPAATTPTRWSSVSPKESESTQEPSEFGVWAVEITYFLGGAIVTQEAIETAILAAVSPSFRDSVLTVNVSVSKPGGRGPCYC